jgi:hypothetical protein
MFEELYNATAYTEANMELGPMSKLINSLVSQLAYAGMELEKRVAELEKRLEEAGK